MEKAILRPSSRRIKYRLNESEPTYPLYWSSTVAVAVCILDMAGLISTSAGIYALVGGIMLLALAIDGSRARKAYRLRPVAVVTAGIFWFWVATVTVYAILSAHWAIDTSIIVFGACIPPFGYVAWSLLKPRIPNSRYVAVSANCMMLVTAVFAIVAIGIGLSTLGTSNPTSGLSHERIFVAVLLLFLPLPRYKRFIRCLIAIAIIVSIIRYASATSLAALAVALAAFLVLRYRPQAGALILFAATLTGLTVVLPKLTDIVDTFYSSVGRINNTSTRELLWHQADAILAANPWMGGEASVPITGLANIGGVIQPVPFHNTLLTIGAVSGYPAIVLFVVMLGCIVIVPLFSTGKVRSAAVRWLPALAAAIVCISVNPVLERIGTAAAFYLLIVAGSLKPLETVREERTRVNSDYSG